MHTCTHVPAAAPSVVGVHGGHGGARHRPQAAGGGARGTGRLLALVLVYGGPVGRAARCCRAFLVVMVVMVVTVVMMMQTESRVVRMQETGTTRLLGRRGWTAHDHHRCWTAVVVDAVGADQGTATAAVWAAADGVGRAAAAATAAGRRGRGLAYGTDCQAL